MVDLNELIGVESGFFNPPEQAFTLNMSTFHRFVELEKKNLL